MFNFLKGEKTEIAVTLDRPNGTYFPGETIGVTVTITPDKELKLKKAVVKLSGSEAYQYLTTTTSTDSEGNESEEVSYEWAGSELFVSEENFLGETTLPAGATQRYSFQMKIPDEGLPTCIGEIVRLEWQVNVKFTSARFLGSDPQAQADLRVLSPAPGVQVQAGEYGGSNEPGEADLALLLPGLEALPGQLVNGQLRILPRKDFAAEVRLEMVRDENVSYDRGNQCKKSFPVKLAGKTKFVAGQMLTLPFQVTIPQDAPPSIQTPNGSIIWVIKGVLGRTLRKDTQIEQTIMVYQPKA